MTSTTTTTTTTNFIENKSSVSNKPEDPNGHFSLAVFPNAAFPHQISSANALGHDVLMTKLKTHNTK